MTSPRTRLCCLSTITGLWSENHICSPDKESEIGCQLLCWGKLNCGNNWRHRSLCALKNDGHCVRDVLKTHYLSCYLPAYGCAVLSVILTEAHAPYHVSTIICGSLISVGLSWQSDHAMWVPCNAKKMPYGVRTMISVSHNLCITVYESRSIQLPCYVGSMQYGGNTVWEQCLCEDPAVLEA
jgi:hypothetical protein